MAEVGVSESLPLTAFIPELPTAAMIDLYRTADAFVMSSLLEGFSSALLEAMAAALPVIVTDSPGCAEFVREEDSGLIVPPRDPAKLAQVMAMLMEDEQTRKQLSVRASQRAAQLTGRGAGCYLQIMTSLELRKRFTVSREVVQHAVKPQVLTAIFGRSSAVRIANLANLRNFPDFFILGPQRTGTT